jgi:hypothetical protein
MKTTLQLLLLTIGLVLSLSVISEPNAGFTFDDDDIKSDATNTGWGKELVVNLICQFSGISNGKPVERIAEIRVNDYTYDNKECSVFTTNLFKPLNKNYYKAEYIGSKTSSQQCQLTDGFIVLDVSNKYDWATQTNINIHRHTGNSSATQYNKTRNINIRLKGACEEYVKENKGNPPTALNKTPKKSRGYSSGTGFYVNKKGLMITNNHVVKSCNKIKVDGSSAVVKSFDTTNDLALLQVESSPSSVPYFSSGKGIRLGDGVTVAGYPLRSVLGSGLNVVTGTVASLSGVKNNSSRLQITAPINSGNSGGPLFDSSGRVVGVIVSKINNTKAREILGEEIQGANFAIKGSVVRSFLDMNDVDYEVSTSNKNMSTADIAENAKEYTALIKCWK